MNVSYPENTIDYDEDFIYVLAASVLRQNELKEFSKTHDLRSIDKIRLSFMKSNLGPDTDLNWIVRIIYVFLLFYFDIYLQKSMVNEPETTTKDCKNTEIICKLQRSNI